MTTPVTPQEPFTPAQQAAAALGSASTGAKSPRAPREADSREANMRPTAWRPAPLLPEPNKHPDYEYAWKRFSFRGEDDGRNMAAVRAEGWEPVLRSEQPQMFVPMMESSLYRDFIAIGGLVLHKIPKQFWLDRSEYYSTFTQRQLESVDNAFRSVEDKRMPTLFSERQSTVSEGKRTVQRPK